LKFIESSQQWDYSNVWAPNQEEIILMLLKYDKEMSLKFARKFFNTVYAGWLKDGMIFEKYSALELGKRGKYRTFPGLLVNTLKNRFLL